MKQADTEIIAKLNQIFDAQAAGGSASFASLTGNPSDNAALGSALDAKQSEEEVQTIADAKVESEAYGPTWDGDTTHAPSKNDVYDKIEDVVASIPPAGVTNAGTEGIVPVTDGSGNLIDSPIASGASSTTVASTEITLDANLTKIGDVSSAGNRTKIEVKDSSGEVVFSTISGSGLVFKLTTLPISDPDVAGQVWNDGGTLRIGAAPYLVYTALLTQSGTDAPVATVLQNTLGGTVVWTRNDTGDYFASLIGAFPVDKSGGIVSGVYNGANSRFGTGRIIRVSDDAMRLTTTYDSFNTLADDSLSETFVQILVKTP